MPGEAEQWAIRRQVAAEQEDGQRRYSDELRGRAARYARERQAEGARGAQVATELGLPWITVRRWLGEDDARPAFLRVEIAGPAAMRAILHGPRGLRVEGVDAHFLAELLRALE
jgi:hypothetical protein